MAIYPTEVDPRVHFFEQADFAFIVVDPGFTDLERAELSRVGALDPTWGWQVARVETDQPVDILEIQGQPSRKSIITKQAADYIGKALQRLSK